MTRVASNEWQSCLADRHLGVAFFDGIRIDTDRITDPRWDRVLPILEEEQILMCRAMHWRNVLKPGMRVLDVGTGSGIFAIWAARHGCLVTAVDCSARAIEFARHNAHQNLGAQLLRGTEAHEIDFKLGRIENLVSEGNLPTPFDLVLLSPPYNPTAPGLKPAQHAQAGLAGLDVFREQLPIALKLINDNGLVVGNQMTFHEAGAAPKWWAQELARAAKARASAYSLVYAPVLTDASEFDARTFLEAQYAHFLNENFDFDAPTPGVREYIESTLNGLADTDVCKRPVFGLYYYEIRKVQEGVEAVEPFRLTALPDRSWHHRIKLHREIVEHTSAQNSFPVPALFLQNDSTPPLPKWDPVSGAKRSQTERFQRSPLSTIGRWLTQTRLIGAEGDSEEFDFVLVDVGPWFDAWEGRRSLQQEVALFAKTKYYDGLELETVLTNYQTNTRCQQTRHLGAFVHPNFSGQSGGADWGTVHCQLMVDSSDASRPSQLLTTNEEELHARWVEELSREFETLQDSTEHTAKVQPIGTGLIAAAFDSKNLAELDVRPQDIAAYQNRLNRECSAFQVTPERHLELIHLTYHKRLRTVLQVDDRHPNTKTILIGVPLRFAFSKAATATNRLPETYRGGVWIFAGTRGTYGPRRETLLLDLARLTVTLETSAVEARATESLSVGLQRDYHASFAHEIKGLIGGIDPESSEDLLRQVHAYFRMLALTPREFDRFGRRSLWTDICEVFPERMCTGASLKGLLENHMQIAESISLLTARIKSPKRRASPRHTKVVWSTNDCDLGPAFLSLLGSPPSNLKPLYFFCAALISAFRNALNHFDPAEGLEISWDQRSLRIHNKIATASADDTDARTGSEMVLLGYVKQYAQGEESNFYFGRTDDRSHWLTKLPLPPGLVSGRCAESTDK